MKKSTNTAATTTRMTAAADIGRECRRWERRDAVRRTQTSRPEGRPVKLIGGDLLSQALSGQVPSALRGLTALFGMGRGVSPSLKPPEKGERPRLSRSFKTAQR